jgi:hypothetical protein
VVETVEVGGRRYFVHEGEGERTRWGAGAGAYWVAFTALRFGKPYGPAFGKVTAKTAVGRVVAAFATVEAAREGIAADAKKRGPYKPTGRYAEKHGFAGREEGK